MTQEYGRIQVWKELVSSVTPMRGSSELSAVRHSSLAPASVAGTPTTIVKSGRIKTVSCSSAETVLWLPLRMERRVESVDENTPGTEGTDFSSSSMEMGGGASGTFGGWVCDTSAASDPGVSVTSRSQSDLPVEIRICGRGYYDTTAKKNSVYAYLSAEWLDRA